VITKLTPNQIFVFGSNTAGNHAGGAARQAAADFGAEDGVGEGLIGRSYAFPTLNGDLSKRSDQELTHSVELLYAACEEFPELEFLLTKVGCGIAGFTEEHMRSFFQNPPDNLILPEDWNG